MPTRTEWRDMLEAMTVGVGMGTQQPSMVNFVRGIQEQRLRQEEARRAQAAQLGMRREEIQARADEGRASRLSAGVIAAVKNRGLTPELAALAEANNIPLPMLTGQSRRSETENVAEKAAAIQSPGYAAIEEAGTRKAGAETTARGEAQQPFNEALARLQDTLGRGRDAARRKEEESKGKTLAERNAERRDPDWDKRTGAEQATAIVKEQTILNAIALENRGNQPPPLTPTGRSMLEFNIDAAIEKSVNEGDMESARALAAYKENPTQGTQAAAAELVNEIIARPAPTGPTGATGMGQPTPPSHVPFDLGSALGDIGGMFRPRAKAKGELVGYGPGGQPIFEE